MVKDENFYAWAINTNDPDGGGFIGRFWFAYPQSIPVHMAGCRIALFRTKLLATKQML
jgi:hypothetical protein